MTTRAVESHVAVVPAVSSDPQNMDRHHVMQEIVFLSASPHDVRYRIEHHPLPASSMPDEHVRALLGWDHSAPDGAVLHSTSWRYDPDLAAVVLTWVAVPDQGVDVGSLREGVADAAQGATGTHPVPDGLSSDHAAGHAIRHLAFLLHTDPVIEDALHNFPDLHDALVQHAPDVARGHHANWHTHD